MLKYLWRIPVYLFCFRAGRRILALAFVLTVLAILFHNIGPQRFRPSSIQRRIGMELVGKAVDEFPWDRDVGSVMMITDREAWAPFMTDAIRARVTNYGTNGSRKFDILPDDFARRVMRTLGFPTTRRALTPSDVTRIVRQMEADTLLLVRFGGGDYVEDAAWACGRLECTFYPKSGEEPRRIEVEASFEKGSGVCSAVANYFRNLTTGARLVWIVIGTLIFPFLVAPVTLSVVERQSARANAFMVLAYAAVLLVNGYVLWGAADDAVEGALMVIAGVLAVWYVIKVSDLIASPGFRQRMQTN